MLGDELGELLGVEAVVVAGRGHEARAGEAEALQRREVGGVLDEHDVVGVDEDARDEAERLLRAGRDEDLVRLGLQAPACEPLCEQRAQLRVALGRRVLQRPRDDGRLQRGRERLRDHLRGKQLGRRQAARERDDLGALRELQDVAHRRGLDVREPRGERWERARHLVHDPGLQDLCCYRLCHGQRRCP